MADDEYNTLINNLTNKLTNKLKIQPVNKDIKKTKITYNKLINIFSKELELTEFIKIKNILEDNNIEERFHTKKDSITYYRKSMNEIFTKLKNEKNNNPQFFYEKYQTNNMITIAVKIWKEEYKLK